jgi:RING-finger-containing ubiquitin ligase
METTLKHHFDLFADKLESALFGENTEVEDQAQYFQSFFTESYVFPTNLLKYFTHEIMLGFLFNVVLFMIMLVYLPFNFNCCWNCNPLMSLWLIFLCGFNAMLVIPKVLLIRKLLRIEESSDMYFANYSLWMFFRSKVYKFNISTSRYIFSTYLGGAILLALTYNGSEECSKFNRLIGMLLGSWLIRAISSFFKFVNNINNPQQEESLMDYFNGISSKEIQSLSCMTYKKYSQKNKRADDKCAICFEIYKEEEELRILECPGDHGFHKHCIDKWLVKSNKCPKCNLSVFSKREKHIKTD